MNKLIEIVVTIIPEITNPISLVAFAIFILAYLSMKLIVQNNLLKQITQKNSFIIINKFLNYVFIVVLVVSLLGIISHFFLAKYLSENDLILSDKLASKEIIQKTAKKANDIRSAEGTISILDKLLEFQPTIYMLRHSSSPVEAYNKVMELSGLYNNKEITPALLIFSDSLLRKLIERPFNYYPPNKADISNFADGYSMPGGAYTIDDPIAKRFLDFLSRDDVNYPYKDFVMFINGEYEDFSKHFPNSRFVDAALYQSMRKSLYDGNTDQVKKLVYEFDSKYNNHRHLDDAFALLTLCYEFSDQPFLAITTALEGIKKPDGDMDEWFEREVFNILERQTTYDELNTFIQNQNNIEDNLLPMFEYTMAQHALIEGKLAIALNVFNKLKSSIDTHKLRSNNNECWDNHFWCYLSGINLEADIQKANKLISLGFGTSSALQYDLGLYFYDTDLIFYNQICKYYYGRNVDRYETRTPESYFLERNNFYRASVIFQEIAAHEDNNLIKQKALFKLARCYFHLSLPASFMPEQLDGKTRPEYLKLCRTAFTDCVNILPTGPIADDALAELGLTYRYSNEYELAINTFLKVEEIYKNRNAVDNSLYHLANIYIEKNERSKAMDAYKRLADKCKSKRWKRIARKETGY